MTDFEVVGSTRAFFAASTGPGVDLWQTDGTASGTSRVTTNLRLGRLLTNDPARHKILYTSITHSGGKLYFKADDGKVGNEIWVLDLPANTQSVGLGCGGPIAGGVRLAADDPVLNKGGAIRLSGATPNSPGVVAVSVPGPRAILIGSGCALFFDPGQVVTAPAVKTDAGGAAQLPFQVPNDSSLIGLRAAVQAGVANAGVPPFGLELSNGVVMTIGK